jgi:hypothetical protein
MDRKVLGQINCQLSGLFPVASQQFGMETLDKSEGMNGEDH